MNLKKTFKFCMIFFIFVFCALLIALETGYYDAGASRKKTLTEQQIRKFEEDVRNGKDVDVTDYLIEESVDYSSGLSNKIYKTSLKLEKVFDKTVKTLFKGLAKTVSD